jgi:hypothetical protein
MPELDLRMVHVPLMVDAESGVDDMLDRDGSRTPIQFHISYDRDEHPIARSYKRRPNGNEWRSDNSNVMPERASAPTCAWVARTYRASPGKIVLAELELEVAAVGSLDHSWREGPPWTELYIDPILKGLPRWSSSISHLLPRPPYRGLGHHIRYLIRVAYREQEDVAGDSQKELMGISVRKRCFYLMPVIRTINLFRRRTQGVK